MTERIPEVDRQLAHERESLLHTLSRALETPMLALGLAWLVLFAVELTRGLPPFLETVNYVIWALFAAHFALEFVVAPRKGRYLRENWITALALVAPAVRVLRITRVVRAARAARAARGVRLVRVVGGLNRGMRALGGVMGRRGFGYVAALTLLVVLAGAAGMSGLERDAGHEQMRSYGTAVWWTAMVITTMGTDFFPRTPEGRLLGLILAVYGFAVFGYITATIASFFVARDAEETESKLATSAQVNALREQLDELRAQLPPRSGNE